MFRVSKKEKKEETNIMHIYTYRVGKSQRTHVRYIYTHTLVFLLRKKENIKGKIVALSSIPRSHDFFSHSNMSVSKKSNKKPTIYTLYIKKLKSRRDISNTRILPVWYYEKPNFNGYGVRGSLFPCYIKKNVHYDKNDTQPQSKNLGYILNVLYSSDNMIIFEICYCNYVVKKLKTVPY